MKSEERIRRHNRLMNNGRFWYCTPVDVRKQTQIGLPFIADAMKAAEEYYIGNTTQATRDHDVRENIRRMKGTGKK